MSAIELFPTKEQLDSRFTELYSKHFGLMYIISKKMLGNHEDAEDATQQALFKAYRALPSALRKEKFHPFNWLYTIVLNECRSELREAAVGKKYGQMTNHENFDEHEESSIKDPKTDIDTIADQLDLRDGIRQALASLTKIERSVLLLRYAYDLSISEVTRRMNYQSEGTTKSTLFRAKNSFRALFSLKLLEMD